MLAFFLKIILCLSIAAAIGFLMAWLLRGLTLNRLREHNYRLTSDLSARDNQVSAAQAQSQDLRAKLTIVERDLAASTTRSTDLQAALSGEQQRTIKIEDDLRLEHERHLALQGIAQQRTSELEAAKLHWTSATREKDSEITRLGSQLAPLLALPAVLSSREADVKALQSKYDEAVSARTKFETELTGLRAALDVSRREHQEQLAHRSQKIVDLERAADSDKARLADLEALTIRRASEVQALQGDVKTLQDRVGSASKEKDLEIARLSAQLAPLLVLPAAVAAKDNELKSLQVKLNESTQALRAKEQELATARGKLDAELAAARGRNDGELSQLKSRLSSMASEMQGRDSTLSTLRVELDAARKTLDSRSALLRESEASKAAAADALKAKDAELARLRTELAGLTGLPARLSSVQAQMQVKLDEAIDARRGLEAELAQLRQTKVPASEQASRRPPRQFASAPAQIDDLKHIYGVGPALEKLLHRLGVYQFKQVALWSADDIKFFDSQLHEFHGRIEREHWVRSAQEEHYKKFGEWLGAGQPAITVPETNR